MDRDAALIIAAKDLFLELWKETGLKFASNVKEDEKPNVFADKFIAFHKRLAKSING